MPTDRRCRQRSTRSSRSATADCGARYGRGLVDWVLLFLWNDKAPNLGFAPVNPPLVWLWALLGIAGIWRYRVFLPLVAWSVVFVLSYTAMRVPVLSLVRRARRVWHFDPRGVRAVRRGGDRREIVAAASRRRRTRDRRQDRRGHRHVRLEPARADRLAGRPAGRRRRRGEAGARAAAQLAARIRRCVSTSKSANGSRSRRCPTAASATTKSATSASTAAAA